MRYSGSLRTGLQLVKHAYKVLRGKMFKQRNARKLYHCKNESEDTKDGKYFEQI